MNIIQQLNNLKINCKSIEWMEDIPPNIYEEHFDKCKFLAEQTRTNKHRWFETSLDVVELPNGLILGVSYVSGVYSESMGVEDCYVQMIFMEMKAVASVSYEFKR